MAAITHRRLSQRVLNRLINEAPESSVTLENEHRKTLSERFRSVASTEHRRLDAWMVERAGETYDEFRWSAATARRILGNASLRRSLTGALAPLEAVEAEITDHLLRAVSGNSRRGSLDQYLASASSSQLAIIGAEAANWTTQLSEVANTIVAPWTVALSDAYYDVACARTTLRGRRDLVVVKESSRVVIRVRNGAPGRSAGPGLRADLSIDALAHPDGQSASRIIGLWLEAGVVLSVDATMDDLRRGARDLVRVAVAQRRNEQLAA